MTLRRLVWLRRLFIASTRTHQLSSTRGPVGFRRSRTTLGNGARTNNKLHAIDQCVPGAYRVPGFRAYR